MSKKILHLNNEKSCWWDNVEEKHHGKYCKIFVTTFTDKKMSQMQRI